MVVSQTEDCLNARTSTRLEDEQSSNSGDEPIMDSSVFESVVFGKMVYLAEQNRWNGVMWRNQDDNVELYPAGREAVQEPSYLNQAEKKHPKIKICDTLGSHGWNVSC